MCGRLTQQLSSDELAQLFGAEDLANDPGSHFNVAPTQSIRVVVEHDGRRVVAAQRWGLIPSWADNARIGARLINARAETVAEKPAFRSAFRRHRCIVPADSFYEWQTSGKVKTPFAVRRNDGQPLAFAGLWASWRNPAADERVASCTIVTTEANSLLAAIHNRMPVILPEDAWSEWLDPTNEDLVALQSLLKPFPAELMQAYPVTRLVNDVRHDGPELVARGA